MQQEEEVVAFALRLNRGQHWHTYLKQGLLLASSSSTNAMHLLIMAAHYYAIVHVAPTMSSLSARGYGKPAIADRQLWLFDPQNPPLKLEIAMPWSASKEAGKDKAKVKADGESEEAKADEKNGKLLTLLTSDPATMLYDAAQILMAERQAPPPPRKKQCHPTNERPAFFRDARLIMLPHTIGLIMLPVLLVPSLLAPGDGMVPGIPGHYSLAKMVLATTCWPIMNASLLCFLASWAWCVLLYIQFGQYKLALCTSMHMTAKILMGLWSMLHRCPLAPIFRPKMVAWGMGTGVALLLVCISHVYYAIPFDSLEFYLHHLWATMVCCPLVQNVGLRGVMWLFKPKIVPERFQLQERLHVD